MLLLIAAIIALIIAVCAFFSDDVFVGVIVSVIAAVLVLVSCAAIVPTGHTGVITTFGEVENRTLDSGLHFIKPWQQVVKMDNRIQKESVNLSCFSSDIQEVSMVYTINYQINKENAQNIYKTIGKKYYETVITPCINESAKIVVAKYSAEELVGERTALTMEIKSQLAAKLEMYNIILSDASIENIDFTDTYTNAVEEKQVAQQNKLRSETEAEKMKIDAEAAAEVKRIEAQAEADAKLIRAEAEAEANRKLAESLNDNVLVNKWIETWNGEMPMVTDSSNNMINIPIG